MNSFQYYNPTRIVFGSQQIMQLDKLVPDNAKVLIIYGGGSAKRTGTLDEVKQALSLTAGREIYEFAGVEPNPEFTTLMRAVDIIKAKQIDFLLALGGGSVLDGSKFIALVAKLHTNDLLNDAWKLLTSYGRTATQALPLGAVLTIPATGSEMNSGGVINYSEKHAKLPFSNPLVFPQFSILDPEKTLTLPTRQVVNGIADAFVHVLEQYLTYPVDAKVQDGFSETLLRTLISESTAVQADPTDMNVRKNIMWTATMALNGLIGVGVPQDWTTHMIGHELTSLYAIDHARTLTLILPSLMRELAQPKREKLLQYAQNVWHISTDNEDEKIEQAIVLTENLFTNMGLPIRLSEVNLDAHAIDAVLAQLKAHNMLQLGEHKANDLSVCKRILQRALGSD